jgi:hypothetical protein
MIKTSATGSLEYFFKGQLQHGLMIAVMVPGFLALALPFLEGASFRGVPASNLAYGLVVVVIAHQVAGWFVFRSQLCFGLLTQLFGRWDISVWAVIFFALFFLRPILSVAIGLADYGSLGGPRWLHIALGLILLIPVVYTLWSIQAYFGIVRALGGDHFREKYRHLPLVNRGAFRYSSNAMYTFAFLIFWVIAFLLSSKAALAAALFQHAYIWVHMYCTEAPDLAVLYDTSPGGTN